MKANTKPLLPDKYYHIYNRGINGETIFKKDTHYDYFLSKYIYYVVPYVNTYAYCLLGNHFHFLVQIKSKDEILKKIEQAYPGKKTVSLSKFISSQFAHVFNGYSQAFNKEMSRTGGLFESPFRRIEVSNDAYFTQLIAYIHHNPQKHGIVKDFRDYPYSSYQNHLSQGSTYLERAHVLAWFGGKDQYENFHKVEVEVDESNPILKLILE